MALYERVMGLEEPRVAVHTLMSAVQEFALGGMTGAQAAAACGITGDAASIADATALRDRILAESSASLNQARRLKALELENVLILASLRVAPYDTVAAVKTRLGVV